MTRSSLIQNVQVHGHHPFSPGTTGKLGKGNKVFSDAAPDAPGQRF
jgi:hypothetical protein